MAETPQSNVAQATVGLNLDLSPSQLPAGALTYAKNAVVEGFDGQSVFYQNEEGNIECTNFPNGFQVIGFKTLPDLKKTIYFLHNPNESISEIGEVVFNSCTYTTILSDKNNECKLNFNIEYPIHKIVSKHNNCSTELYWTDGYNPRRYLDLDNLPWKESKDPLNSFKPIQQVGVIDCNKLLVQPNIKIPHIDLKVVSIGGQLRMGTYQYTIAYSNSLGEVYTSYYNVTNPVSIFENKTGQITNLPTTKSIALRVEDLDTTGLYDYFNLVVIHTINGITTPELIGTFPIVDSYFEHNHTGEVQSDIRLSMEDIFEKYQYYDIAQDVTAVDQVLVWADLKANKRLNYQNIWSKVKLQWESYKIPYNEFEGYSNGINTANYKGYFRDEVYAFEGAFILKNGKQTDSFPIPGRTATSYDRDIIVNDDAVQIVQNKCAEPEPKERWQVYNTGTVIDFTEEYKEYQKEESNCYEEHEYDKKIVNVDLNVTNECMAITLDKPLDRDIDIYFAFVNECYWWDNGPDWRYASTFMVGSYKDPFIYYYPIGWDIIPKGEYTETLPGPWGFDYQRMDFPTGQCPNDNYYTTILRDVGQTKRALTPYKIAEEDRFPIVFHIPAGQTRVDFCNCDIRRTDGSTVAGSPGYSFYQGSILVPGSRWGKDGQLLGNTHGWMIKAFFKSSDPCVTIRGKVRDDYYEGSDRSNFTMLGRKFPEVIPVPDTEPCTRIINTVEVCEDCYKGSYQYGEFGYWESEYTYPNNPDIWGDLAGQKIRHHKFPDNVISPIHDNNPIGTNSFTHSIFPIGVRLDMSTLVSAIQNSGLSQEDIDQIQGFKIIRANRKTHESIIAKGLLNNVGKTVVDDQETYYPNYPYNDIGDDPYYKITKSERLVETPPGFSKGEQLSGFSDNDVTRFTFHSPDTLFYQPTLSNDGQYLKLESILYGKSHGHFVQIKDNAEYKFLTKKQIGASVSVGAMSGFILGAGQFGWPNYNYGNVIPVSNQMMELLEKLSPFSNFGYMYTSVGYYSNQFSIPNGDNLVDGFKIRNIDYIRRALPGKLRIEEGNTLTNFDRETSIYLHTVDDVKVTHEYSSTIPKDSSRYNLASLNDGLPPENIRQRPISAYYGSIKRYMPSQYGLINSYERIDTGFYSPLKDTTDYLKEVPAIFGGDVFINRFAYKSKHPIFRQNTVGRPNQSDIQYSEIGTLGNPMFWLSTKPANYDIDIENEVDDVSNEVFGGGIKTVLLNLMTGSLVGIIKGVTLMFKLAREIHNKIGIKNVNFDRHEVKGITEQGIMYLFVYGIPYYFCESQVNTDLRQATDENEGDFFPNVGDFIPDDWLQESRVSIQRDNIYFYNQTYSKQNKENFYSRLREDWDPNKLCYTEFPNRAIWSDKSTLAEHKNNWLVYRPVSYFDFPKSNGTLTAIDTIQHNQVLVRFSERSQIYNALTTVNVEGGLPEYLGNSQMFAAPPMDVSITDIGSGGSQHKFLTRTPYGTIYVDAKRGHVILLQNQTTTNLSTVGMSRWLALNLPFELEAKVPNIDNHFNGIGLHGVYDEVYHRLILTKLDYRPLKETIHYDSGKFWDGPKPTREDTTSHQPTEISLEDSRYFCNISWTLSYNFKVQSWTSWHSYFPRFYVPFSTYFQSGNFSKLWNHNTTFEKYNTFYGQTYPYVLEWPFTYQVQDEILKSISEYVNVRKYYGYDVFVEPEEITYFNKSIIYNNQQSTGLLELVPKDTTNLQSYGSYPRSLQDRKQILVAKSDNLYQYNDIWNSLKDKTKPMFINTCGSLDKELDGSNFEYSSQFFKRELLRSKDTKVRHILDNRNDVRLISRFILTQTSKSYK